MKALTPHWTRFSASLPRSRSRHTFALPACLLRPFGIAALLGACILLAGRPPLLAAPSSSSTHWTLVAPLLTARTSHTSTLLPNGKVLVTGGDNSAIPYPGNSLVSAELYDPVTGTWSATGNLVFPRYIHTATLLANGKVLVVGGWTNAGSYLSTSELYDPSTGKWTATGSLNVARGGHAATLLGDGRVLVAGGGSNSNPGFTATAELYDPATGQWSLTGSLSIARQDLTVNLLPNGQAVVIGGIDSYNMYDTIETYDPGIGNWTVTGHLLTPRFGHTATLLDNGAILVAGGRTYGQFPTSGVLNTAELYDSATGNVSATGSMSSLRMFHTASLLPNGLVLVAGGADIDPSDFIALNSVEIYNPATGLWSSVAALNDARFRHTATLLRSGRVLAVGGWNGGSLGSVERYDGPPWSTQTTVWAAPNPVQVTDPVTLTAQVTSSHGVPTGTITFKDAGAVVATVPLSNGTASTGGWTLSLGSHLITARYSGDVDFDPSSGSVSVLSLQGLYLPLVSKSP